METYHSDVFGCFICDLQETLQRHTNGTSWIRTTKMSWWRTTETLLGVLFETCLRRRGGVLMGRRCYVLLRRRHDVPIRCCGDVPLRRLGDVLPRRRWVFHLRHTCNVVRTYWEASLRHLVTGWEKYLKGWERTKSPLLTICYCYIPTSIAKNFYKIWRLLLKKWKTTSDNTAAMKRCSSNRDS